jgi:large subunit ribosomal protein L21
MMPETACLGDGESIEFPLLCGGRQTCARADAGDPQKSTYFSVGCANYAANDLEQTTMYAVFRAGGKQYRAAKGDILRLEKIEAEEGATVKFDEVLLVGEGADVKVGSPLLSGSSVSGKVLKQGKSKKVSVIKFKRRQNYLRQGTHRQFFTEVEITSIAGGGAKAAKASSDAPAAKDAPAEGEVAKKETAKKASKKAAPKKAASKKKATKKSAAKKTAKKKAADE